MLTPKWDESIVKDIKSTERIKLQKYYSQIETHERMFKIKEDVFLKKIEQDLLEEYEFYIKVYVQFIVVEEIITKTALQKISCKNRINETLESLKIK